MIYKTRPFITKNKLILIFLSYYIIGLIFSVVFHGDITAVTESVMSGIKSLKQSNGISSVLRMSMSCFSVSLVMWSFLVLLAPYRLISWLGVGVSFFTGYSSGISSTIVLKAFPYHGLRYIMLCIAPATIIRFFLWYIFYKYCIRGRSDKRNEKNRYHHLLNMLAVILISDVLISLVSVILSDIMF